MASNGMKEAGYRYINIDDTWEAGRDAQGNIQTNKKFPDMKALADLAASGHTRSPMVPPAYIGGTDLIPRPSLVIRNVQS